MECKMKIGFIGLGIMGKPMSKNLLKAGHELTVLSTSRTAAELAAAGAKVADTYALVGGQSEIVITMLPNSPEVKAVVMREHGILKGAKPGTILIDMSSIAPTASQEIERACHEKGVRMLDAPVSGGEPKAIDGTLSIMVGGEKNLFNSVKDILLCMGASAIYCGKIGAGNTAKLANQIIVALNIAACAEGFAFAKKAGVDPALVFDAIRGGLAGSAVMDAKLPMMLKNNYIPGFKLDLHIKDLGNVLHTGMEVGIPLPLTSQVTDMMKFLQKNGFGGEDHSALARYYADISGASIGE
jgi:2-hydroxy-3-oxopropionate reductase